MSFDVGEELSRLYALANAARAEIQELEARVEKLEGRPSREEPSTGPSLALRTLRRLEKEGR